MLAMHYMDRRVIHSTRENPIFADCYNNKKVHFALDRDPRQYLPNFFTDCGSPARHFRCNIRSYNSTMSMEFMTANWQ